MRRILILAMNGLLLSCAAAVADPKAAAAPPAEATETFGDWTLRCGVSPSSGERACEIEASVTQPGQSQPIAQMAFGRPVKPPGSAPAGGGKQEEGTTRLVVIVPASITIAPGINVVANPIDPYLSFPFKSCMQAACFAEIELTDEQMKAFHNRTTPGQLIFADPANKPVMLEFSYKGLDQALELRSQNGNGPTVQADSRPFSDTIIWYALSRPPRRV